MDKLITRHNVDPAEVEEVFFNPPYAVRRSHAGKRLLYGRSQAGRYLFVVFAQEGHRVKVISARDMTDAERRFFRKNRK